jgi:methyl-accepting chemotaxis protein
MTGPIFPFEISFLFILMAGCAYLAVYHLLFRLAKKNRGPGLVALSFLFLGALLAQFLAALFQENHLLLRFLEQTALTLQYASVFGVYRVFSVLARKQGAGKKPADSPWAIPAALAVTAGIVYLTDFAVSGKLSYMKGLGGTTYYVTDISFLAPVVLAVAFLIVIAGLVRFLRTKQGKSLWSRPLSLVTFLLLLTGFILQAASMAGIWNAFIFRSAFFLGLTASFAVWSASLFLPGLRSSGAAEYSEEQERLDVVMKDLVRTQGAFLNGQFSETMTRMEELLDTSGALSATLMENETLFNSFFALVKDSTDNQKTLMDSLQQRDDLVASLQNESGNQSLLVPLLLTRWQGFYNEVKGITGNSSETAQFIDKLISSADNGKVLIQQHLKATNNIRLSTDKVRFIVELINDISEQTNILSINAAIEAYHAGAHGRGFSIIAEEIRQVATTTLQESNAISECIGRILENSKAEESLVKENETIFNDFSKSMERLFVYILNVIEVTKELRQKMDKLLGELRMLDSGVQPVLQQEQFKLSVFQKETREIHQYIEEGKSLSEDHFRISVLFAELAAIREKQRTASQSAEELKKKWMVAGTSL